MGEMLLGAFMKRVKHETEPRVCARMSLSLSLDTDRGLEDWRTGLQAGWQGCRRAKASDDSEERTWPGRVRPVEKRAMQAQAQAQARATPIRIRIRILFTSTDTDISAYYNYYDGRVF